MTQVVAPVAGRTGDRTADRGDRGGGAGRQRAGTASTPAATATPPPASRCVEHRHRAGRLARRPPRRSNPAGPPQILQPVTEAVRTNTDIAFITIMSPDGTRFTHTDPQPDRRALPRHHRACAARRDVHRGVHRHAGPVDPGDRAGARRIGPRRRPGVGGHHAADAGRSAGATQWPTIAAVGARRTGCRTRRGVGDPAPAAAPDPRAAARRAAGDVRTPRRDPAFGVRGARSCSTATGWCWSTTRPAGCSGCRRAGSTQADLPEFLRSVRPRARATRCTSPTTGCWWSTGPPWMTRDSVAFGGRDDPRPHRIAGRAGRTQLAAGPDRLAARAGARGRQQAAHRDHDGRDGPADEAVKFATDELALSQRLVDRLSSDVGEPALVALLLGKTAQADERGIALTVTEDTHLPSNTDDCRCRRRRWSPCSAI